MRPEVQAAAERLRAGIGVHKSKADQAKFDADVELILSKLNPEGGHDHARVNGYIALTIFEDDAGELDEGILDAWAKTLHDRLRETKDELVGMLPKPLRTSSTFFSSIGARKPEEAAGE